MKKILGLALLVLTFQGAMARSLLSSSLEYTKTNKRLSATPNHALNVYVDGQVVHRQLSPQLPLGGGSRVVIRLSSEQMSKIARLVRRSNPVLPGFERSHIQCFAPSSFTEKFTASNGSIFLRQGAQCDGGFRINAQKAAVRLSQVLSLLENAAHTRFNFAQLEAQVDNLLN